MSPTQPTECLWPGCSRHLVSAPGLRLDKLCAPCGEFLSPLVEELLSTQAGWRMQSDRGESLFTDEHHQVWRLSPTRERGLPLGIQLERRL